MLTTARLELRLLVETDAPALLAMSGEAGVRRWIPDQVYRDEAHAAQVVRALIAAAGAGDPRVQPYVLGVVERATGVLVGHVGLSAARRSVEVGYAIAEARHGLGLATEAVAAAVRWALADLGLPEILGVVAADNAASRRVLEKAGFALVADEGARLVYRAA